jgi:hypothetical protein
LAIHGPRQAPQRDKQRACSVTPDLLTKRAGLGRLKPSSVTTVWHSRAVDITVNGQSRYGTSTGLPHASLELRWRTCTDFTVRWGCLAAVGIASAVGLRVSGVSVVTSSLVSQSEWPATILAFACAYSLIGARIPRFAVPIAITSDFLLSVAQLLAAIIVLLPLSYLAAVPALPLIDSELAKLDASLFGFDWQSATGWIVRYPLLERILAHAYASFTYQAAAVLFIGSIARPADRNGDLIWSFVIAGLLTCAVFVFTPAIGNVGHLGQGYVMALNEIRSGQWTVLDYSHAQGMIEFPSFHTTAAVLMVYAVRHNYWALGIFIPLNVLLLAATLPIGGHYLVDLPAGGAVAVLALAATRFARSRLASGLNGSS